MEKATFGAGCFWGVEATFRQMDGVVSVTVGYTGGTAENPSYEDVCSGSTGHAEAVEVLFDPDQVSYDDLLEVFWDCHDPTQDDRQGSDIGTQYRSAVFFHDPDQEEQARVSKQVMEESGRFPRRVVTEIRAAGPFYRAEEDHQQYFQKKGVEPSCRR